MKYYIECDGKRFTRLWHCFGNSHHMAEFQVIRGLLEASQTNVLPINTHRLSPETGMNGLELGYAGVKIREFESQHDVSSMIKMLNINLETSAKGAIEKTKLAVKLTGEKVIKLEVLNADRKTSNQAELITAVRELTAWDPSLMILPLLANDLQTAKELVATGCSMLRVMGSAIGSCSGIADQEELARICNLGLPVILDGGIGSIDHVNQALDAGVSGILVNSMLFDVAQSPVEVMRSFAAEFGKALECHESDLI